MGGVLSGVLNLFTLRRERLVFGWRPFVLGLTGVVLAVLIARLPLPQAVLLIGGLAFIAGTLWEPLVGIVAALFLGPLRAWLPIYLPVVPAWVGQIALVAMLGSWVAQGLAKRDLRLPFPPLTLPLIGFLGVALLSLWSPVDAWASFLEFGKWAQIAIVFLVVYDRLVRPGAAWRVGLILLGVVGSTVAQALMGIWQFAFQSDGVENFAIDDRFYRAYGTFQQPNPYGGFLSMVATFLIGLVAATLVDRWRARDRVSGWVWMAGGTAGLIVTGLIASWSRGAWMGFVAASLAMVTFLPRRALWGALLVSVLIVGGIWLMTSGRLPPAIENRLTGFIAYARFEDVRGAGVTDANYAVIERMAHWQAAFNMWRANFWLGVGLGGYEGAYADHALINWPLPLGHAHNYYFNLLAETGTLGLLAFIVWLGVLYGHLIRAVWRLDDWRRGMALGLIGAWTHFAVHSLVDVLLVNNVHLHLAVFLALSAWLAWISADR